MLRRKCTAMLWFDLFCGRGLQLRNSAVQGRSAVHCALAITSVTFILLSIACRLGHVMAMLTSLRRLASSSRGLRQARPLCSGITYGASDADVDALIEESLVCHRHLPPLPPAAPLLCEVGTALAERHWPAAVAGQDRPAQARGRVALPPADHPTRGASAVPRNLAHFCPV